MRKTAFTFCVILIGAFLFVSSLAGEEKSQIGDKVRMNEPKKDVSEFPKGQVIFNVACKKDPETHYNLWLPENYDPEKKWPLLWVFSPGGDARFDLYQDVAEKLGWIMIGAVECKNGPTPPKIKHRDALMKEITTRFSVHPHRMYASGFSGGAGMSWGMMFTYSEWFDGIVPIATGYHIPLGKPHPIKWAVIKMNLGREDAGNYKGVMQQYKRCVSNKYFLRFDLELHDGGHIIPPKEKIHEYFYEIDKLYYTKQDRILPIDVPVLREKAEAAGNTIEGYEYYETLSKLRFLKGKAKNEAQKALRALKKNLAVAKEVDARKMYLSVKSFLEKKKKPSMDYINKGVAGLRKIIKRWPDTVYGKKAKEKLEELRKKYQ